jgi:Cytochrome oxidase complex assembly protein 1
MEKASQDKKIVEAIGEPIIRGPWYNATLAINQNKHSVSCTCPITGPQGSGILKLKAVQAGGIIVIS